MDINSFLLSFSVINNNKIDKEATLIKFKDNLNLFASSFDEEQNNIKEAIEQVFSEFNEEYIVLDMLVTLALLKLNVQIENHSRLKKAIVDHIKSSNDLKVVLRKGVKKLSR